MLKLNVNWMAFAISVCSIAETSARSFRVGMLPNGRTFHCATCHRSPGGGGPRNAFGEAVNALTERGSRAKFWSAALAALDSDGDGFTNGEELGDPDGDGTAESGLALTHPGDANSKPAPPVAAEPEPEPQVPTQPVVITASLSENVLKLTWEGGKGPYTIQRKLKLDEPVWTDMTTTSEKSLVISVEDPKGFFRVGDIEESGEEFDGM